MAAGDDDSSSRGAGTEPSHEDGTPPESIHPLRDGLLTALAIALVSWTALAAVFLSSRNVLLAETRNGLLRSAQAATGLIDAAVHATAVAEARMSVAAYDDACRALRAPRAAGIDYYAIYTMILRRNTGQDRLFVVFDSSRDGATKDADGDGMLSGEELLEPYDMGEYYDAPDTIRQTLLHQRPIVTNDTFTDAFGTFISAFVPLRTVDGEVIAAVGCDLDAIPFLDRQETLAIIAAICAAGALAAAAVVGFLVWRARNGQLRLAVVRRDGIEALRRARDRAQAGERAKAAFLSVMSHELRTPLNGVLGMSDLLLGTRLDGEQREMAALVRRSGQELLALVDGVLDYAALSQGAIAIRPAAMDPSAPLEEAATLAAATADAKGLEIAVALDPALPVRVLGDQMRIRQMLMPLIDNAIRHGARSRVLLRALVIPGGVRYQVEDDGAGLPDQALARLGQPFAPGGELMHHQRGAGLGLALASRLAALMDGSLGLSPGSGTRIGVSLPMAELAGSREWPSAEGQRRVAIIHRDEAVRSALADDCRCLGLQPVGPGACEVIVADLPSLAAHGLRPHDLAVRADRAIVICGLADHARLAPELAEAGVVCLPRPMTRQALGAAITGRDTGISGIIRSLRR